MKSGPSTASDPERPSDVPFETASVPAAIDAKTPAVMSASHEVLFQLVDERRCDACGDALPAASAADDDDDGYGVGGQGVYMWTRGDEVRFESAPLCASCASAIGMTALARWEIEEEEG